MRGKSQSTLVRSLRSLPKTGKPLTLIVLSYFGRIKKVAVGIFLFIFRNKHAGCNQEWNKKSFFLNASKTNKTWQCEEHFIHICTNTKYKVRRIQNKPDTHRKQNAERSYVRCKSTTPCANKTVGAVDL